jgi:hypothetical protein
MPDKLAGSEILLRAHELITRDRQNTYAHPLEDYSRTVAIFNAMKGEQVMTAEDGILFMVCVKLSRLMNEMKNGLDVPDNIIDAAGYIGCLEMVRKAKHRNWEHE